MDSRRFAATRPKTKVVCTLGPATESEEVIRSMIDGGMSIARLNLSHGDATTHAAAIEMVRRVSAELDIPVGIMVDVPGSKYRTGPLAPGVIDLVPGNRITLTSDDIVGNEEIVAVAPPGIHRDARVGHPILVDDGLVELLPIEVNGHDVLCEVVVGGRLTERRGVTTPGRAPSQVFPDERTIEALIFAAEHDADFVALSTVVDEDDVHKARAILNEHNLFADIISKVERAEAIENFDRILEASDCIMVARGDMGVEVPLARVPVIQKELISKCNAAGKPVITATQMLESMTNSVVPTRAEVTDVANAVFDGTDAVMLSGESSVGRYPVQATKVMCQVAIEAEKALPYETMIREKWRQTDSKTEDALCYDACATAYQIKAGLIVAFTESGATATRVSRYRPEKPILALTPDARVQRRLMLRWGVIPIEVHGLSNVEDFFAFAEEQAQKTLIFDGRQDTYQIVLVAGVPIGVPGGTNLLRVMTVTAPT